MDSCGLLTCRCTHSKSLTRHSYTYSTRLPRTRQSDAPDPSDDMGSWPGCRSHPNIVRAGALAGAAAVAASLDLLE